MPPALNLTKLEDQRRYLICFIEQCTPQGSLKNHVTIVFDGNIDVFGGMASTVAKIIFSQNETADETIKRIVAAAQNTKNMVVVSDDRDIQYAVRALGAKVNGVQTFLDKGKGSRGKGRNTRKGSGGGKSEKYVSKKDEFKIMSEMENIWLKSKEK